MSRWNLTYKGTEILTPEEWNTVIDALEALDTRIKCGIATFNGDGYTNAFLIEHGFIETPTCVMVGKASPDLPDIDYWTADETYITVFFKEAPPEGEENVKLWYMAILIPPIIYPSP